MPTRTPAPTHRESFEVFCQSAGLRTIQAAMFKAWLKEHGQGEPQHATHADWSAWYRQALSTVVNDY